MYVIKRRKVIKMTENAILLIFGAMFIVGFFSLSAIISSVLEKFDFIDKIAEKLNIPMDNWENSNY